jgi:hypothetical protein
MVEVIWRYQLPELLSSADFRDAWSLLSFYVRVSSVLIREKTDVKSYQCLLSATPCPSFFVSFQRHFYQFWVRWVFRSLWLGLGKVNIVSYPRFISVVKNIRLCFHTSWLVQVLSIVVSSTYYVMGLSWYLSCSIIEWLPSISVAYHQRLRFVPMPLGILFQAGSLVLVSPFFSACSYEFLASLFVLLPCSMVRLFAYVWISLVLLHTGCLLVEYVTSCGACWCLLVKWVNMI